MIKSKRKKTTANKELIIDDEYINEKVPTIFSEFNNLYSEFIALSSRELSKEEDNERVEIGTKCAIMIAKDFDLDNGFLSEKKASYIEFAREMLYEASNKPYYNELAIIYLVRALYGQTNIAYPRKQNHLQDGNLWVTHLERNTDNHTLKAYALSLRAYIYMVYGSDLEMDIENRAKESEKDLIYATKWDEDNYLAYFSLGLVYYDSATSKHDEDKAELNFSKVLTYKDKTVPLDEYLSKDDKERIINNAASKVK